MKGKLYTTYYVKKVTQISKVRLKLGSGILTF